MTYPLNIVGKKFDKLTVQKYLGKGKWECLCECGNICIKHTRPLTNKKEISCGCDFNQQKSRERDFSGVEFFNLKVIEQTERPKEKRKGGRYWLCKCKCGNETVIATSEIYKIKSCGCLNHKARLENAKKGGLKNRKGIVALENDALRGYKRSVLDRRTMVKKDIKFLLSDEEAINLFHQPCFYCGSYDIRKNSYLLEKKYYLNGIDRIDNDKSYTLDNCVPCCKTCNYAKRNLTQKQFFDWAKRLYKTIYKKE